MSVYGYMYMGAGALEAWGIRSHGVRVIGSCEPPKMGAGNSPLQKKQTLLTTEHSLQPWDL